MRTATLHLTEMNNADIEAAIKAHAMTAGHVTSADTKVTIRAEMDGDRVKSLSAEVQTQVEVSNT